MVGIDLDPKWEMSSISPQDMMICAAAREVKDKERVFVGIGLPVLATLLAQKMYAPNAVLIYESGIIGAKPTRLALSIADPGLVSGSTMLVEFFDLFTMFLQNGNVDLGFVGGAQVDRFGNVNSTVIGSYSSPKKRLPGGGGAYDMTMAKRSIIIMAHEKRRFVEKVDFVTMPGHRIDGISRKELGMPGIGPDLVISTMGVFRFDEAGEMYLYSFFKGTSPEQIRSNTGWNLKIATNVQEMRPPSNEELDALRSLDPKGLISGNKNK